ncbi:MAG: hypothetical protein R3C20_18525 [Planctomycetaceae bacterium]
MRVDATGCRVTEEGAWRDIDSSELRMFSVVAEAVGDHIGVDGRFEDGFTKGGRNHSCLSINSHTKAPVSVVTFRQLEASVHHHSEPGRVPWPHPPWISMANGPQTSLGGTERLQYSVLNRRFDLEAGQGNWKSRMTPFALPLSHGALLLRRLPGFAAPLMTLQSPPASHSARTAPARYSNRRIKKTRDPPINQSNYSAEHHWDIVLYWGLPLRITQLGRVWLLLANEPRFYAVIL